jgi:hypothetical protein
LRGCKKSIKPHPGKIFLATDIQFYNTNKLLEDKNRYKWEENQIRKWKIKIGEGNGKSSKKKAG